MKTIKLTPALEDMLRRFSSHCTCENIVISYDSIEDYPFTVKEYEDGLKHLKSEMKND